jgi:hypothetical protein
MNFTEEANYVASNKKQYSNIMPILVWNARDLAMVEWKIVNSTGIQSSPSLEK